MTANLYFPTASALIERRYSSLTHDRKKHLLCLRQFPLPLPEKQVWQIYNT
ncbi:MAG: hypothetical protein ACRD2G_18300 [Terriglobia bacterium]